MKKKKYVLPRVLIVQLDSKELMYTGSLEDGEEGNWANRRLSDNISFDENSFEL